MPIRVAYDALPNTSDFALVRADVQRQLPLRNLHWVRRTGANRTIRTIQALNVEFKPLEAFGPTVNALSLLDRPYAYILFVVCDVSLGAPAWRLQLMLNKPGRTTTCIAQQSDHRSKNGSMACSNALITSGSLLT